MDSLAGARVLVTGAGGFVGAHLVHALAARGSKVSAVLAPGGEATFEGTVCTLKGDLTDEPFVEELVAHADPAVIYHLAALLGEAGAGALGRVSRPAFSAADQVRVNVGATANLLEAARGRDLVFVFPSTAEVYGRALAPLKEDTPVRPASLYGASKAAAEAYVLSYHRRGELKTTIFRPMSAYGPGQRPMMFIPQLLDAALTHRRLAVSDLSKKRDFLYVGDMVEAFVRAPLSPEAWGEVINLGSGKPTALGEVVRLAEEIVGYKIAVDEGARPDKRGDVAAIWPDIRKAERLLGWTPTTDLRNGLEKTIALHRVPQPRAA